jgi:hypothetical protein
MRQTVMRFADASARNTALSGILTEGLVAYLKDVDQFTAYNGSAWVILGYVGSLPTWTPVVTQGNLLTVTTNHATYHRQGKQIKGSFNVTYASGTSVAANIVTIGVPFTPFTGAGINDVIGTGFIYDSSGPTKYRGHLVLAGALTMQFLTAHSTTDGYLGSTDFTAALAANDIITGQFQFELGSASA